MKKALSLFLGALIAVSCAATAFAAPLKVDVNTDITEEVYIQEGVYIEEGDVLIAVEDGVSIYKNARATKYKLVFDKGTPAYDVDRNYIGDTPKSHTITTSVMTGYFKLSYKINGQGAYIYAGDYSSRTRV